MNDFIVSRMPRALFVVFALTLSVLSPQPVAAQTDLDVGPVVGSMALSASVDDLDGNAVELLDLVRDKPTVLEFWATWCENCEALQPELDRVWAEYGDRVNMVAVAVGVAQSPRRVRRHLEKKHDPGYPYVYDARGEAVRAYRAPVTSVVVILDADGTVVYTGAGPDQDLVGPVRALLEEG